LVDFYYSVVPVVRAYKPPNKGLNSESGFIARPTINGMLYLGPKIGGFNSRT